MNTEKAREYLEKAIPDNKFLNSLDGNIMIRELAYLLTKFANQQKKEAFEAGAREMRENIKQEYIEYLGNGIINPEMAIVETPLPEYKEAE